MLDNNSLKREGLNLNFKFTVLDSKIQEAGVQAAKKYFSRNPQRGFRPGRLPKNFINSKSHEFRSMVLTQIISKSINDIFKELKLNPFLEPEVDLANNIVGENLICEVSSVIVPEVDEELLKKEKINSLKSSVPAEVIEKSVNRLLDNFSSWEKIDQAVNINDGLVLKFKHEDKDHNFRLRLEDDTSYIRTTFELFAQNNKINFKNSSEHLDKFVDNISGLVGKDKGFSFSVNGIEYTIDSVLKIVRPDLTKEFLQSLGVMDGSQEGLSNSVEELLSFQLQKVCDNYEAEQFFKFCDEKVDFKVPSKLVDKDIAANKLEDSEREDVEKRLKRNMLISALIVHGEIELDNEKVEAEVVYRMRELGMGYTKQIRKLVEDEARYTVAQTQAIEYAKSFMEVVEHEVAYDEIEEFVNRDQK